MALQSGVHGEVKLSANRLRDQIKTLLGGFGIDPRAFRIYPRQDPDTES